MQCLLCPVTPDLHMISPPVHSKPKITASIMCCWLIPLPACRICLQVERLLACSEANEAHPSLAALKQVQAALSLPLAASNRGSAMLRSMGWTEGTGLGRKRQGQTEPLPIVKRAKHLGLGAEMD